MTLLPLVSRDRRFSVPLNRHSLTLLIAISSFIVLQPGARHAHAQGPAAASTPDVLVLSNGDTLHGKLVNEIGGKLTFHTDSLGDLSIGWDKVKELHTGGSYAVLAKTQKMKSKKNAAQIPSGALEVADKAITVRPEGGAPPAPIPVGDAVYIMDKGTLDKQLFHHPGFMTGWNGAATAGAAIVTGSQNQYTFSGGVGLVRVIPTVSWLTTRNRTAIDFTGSFGKITQPSYTVPASGTTPPVFVPSIVTKSALYHAEAERDEYFSARMFALVQAAFDHNYAQDLDLQQIYGGGIGWTVLKTPKQEADLKATVQYEKQQFRSDSSASENLIGSTFAASYVLHQKLVTYTQGFAFIPAFNDPRAYSANETNTLAFPAFKDFSFSLGTLDSYVNDSPSVVSTSQPPVKRNSFQFTMGLTYAIKSKY
ncbi:MAG TPA: DUF481 domain-containing protein [Terracidiphilus sp.]|jgi:hypothetical protein